MCNNNDLKIHNLKKTFNSFKNGFYSALIYSVRDRSVNQYAKRSVAYY